MSTESETHGVILSPDAASSFAVATALETLGTATVRSLIELLVTIAADTHIWHWGDGEGGAIHQIIDEVAAEQGLRRIRNTRYVPRRTVYLLADRDSWDCSYCGQHLHGGPFSLPDPHVDHVFPQSRGGSDRLDNLVLACPGCNSAKGARTPAEWEEQR